MSISLKINDLIFKQKVKKKDFYAYLGISKQTLEDYLNEKTSMTVATLEKVATYFKVPIGYFLEDGAVNINNGIGLVGSNNSGNITLSQQQREVEMLRQQLQDKNEIIALLKQQLKSKK